jgi:hypothetical protein
MVKGEKNREVKIINKERNGERQRGARKSCTGRETEKEGNKGQKVKGKNTKKERTREKRYRKR